MPTDQTISTNRLDFNRLLNQRRQLLENPDKNAGSLAQNWSRLQAAAASPDTRAQIANLPKHERLALNNSLNNQNPQSLDETIGRAAIKKAAADEIRNWTGGNTGSGERNIWNGFGGGDGHTFNSLDDEENGENEEYPENQYYPIDEAGDTEETEGVNNDPNKQESEETSKAEKNEEGPHSNEEDEAKRASGVEQGLDDIKAAKGAEEVNAAANTAKAITAASGEEAAATGMLATSELWLPILGGFAIFALGFGLLFAIALNSPSSASALETSSGTGTASAGKPTNTIKKNDGWTLKEGVDYSGVKCATGSKDEGTYTHPIKKFTIRKCDTKVGIVASINSQNILNLIAAAKADGISLGGSSFRSYERQQELYNQNCTSSGCNPPTAKPGNSMHEKGLATDFTDGGNILSKSDADYKWLVKNASQYGYYNLPSEPWHWSTSGN